MGRRPPAALTKARYRFLGFDMVEHLGPDHHI
jgi:hypothetical protein